jgi:hypothetical protein
VVPSCSAVGWALSTQILQYKKNVKEKERNKKEKYNGYNCQYILPLPTLVQNNPTSFSKLNYDYTLAIAATWLIELGHRDKQQ